MQSTKPGIAYKLFNFKSDDYQEVRFTEKVDGQYVAGTTNEEVIEMMIDRFYQLNKKSYFFPSIFFQSEKRWISTQRLKLFFKI